MTPSTPAIEIEQLHEAYGKVKEVQAVNGVSMCVEQARSWFSGDPMAQVRPRQFADAGCYTSHNGNYPRPGPGFAKGYAGAPSTHRLPPWRCAFAGRYDRQADYQLLFAPARARTSPAQWLVVRFDVESKER